MTKLEQDLLTMLTPAVEMLGFELHGLAKMAFFGL